MFGASVFILVHFFSSPRSVPASSPYDVGYLKSLFTVLVGFGVLAATELAPWGALVGLVWVEYPTSTAYGIAGGLA